MHKRQHCKNKIYDPSNKFIIHPFMDSRLLEKVMIIEVILSMVYILNPESYIDNSN